MKNSWTPAASWRKRRLTGPWGAILQSLSKGGYRWSQALLIGDQRKIRSAKLQQDKFWLDLRRKRVQQISSTGTGYSESLENLHPLKFFTLKGPVRCIFRIGPTSSRILDQITPKGPIKSRLFYHSSVAISHKSWSKENKAKISLLTLCPVTAAFSAVLILVVQQ